ncbi:FMN reductase [Phyllobacterium sophorae]|uniref:FMN reductase n=1 Tax=Phyllobacterium sophorae TaxID=1520277 RepID=A0A2P7BFH7_9HYPH|nr:FMN reductase [Phyllobacterium sophorae]PSH65182.1 FMN reductase [Phyllobacterium sophorae]
MPNPAVVGISGNFQRPSKSRSLVADVVGRIGKQYGLASEVYDLIDFGDTLGSARHAGNLDDAGERIIARILAADVLVVGTPTYKGSYTGLFKHVIDLLDPFALQGKPVLLTATGGSDRHALIIEHQLRPLFGFFMAHTLPTGIFAIDRDFQDYEIVTEHIGSRIAQAVREVRPFLNPRDAITSAAE